MHILCLALCAIAWLAGTPPLAAATLSLKSDFAPYFGGDGWISKVEELPDGRLLVAGNFDRIGHEYISAVSRLQPDGSVDPSFQVRSCDAEYKCDFLVQDDGKILAWGDFTHVNGMVRVAIVRLTSEGAVDVDFQVRGLKPNEKVFDAKVMPDGSYRVVGIDLDGANPEKAQLLYLSSTGEILQSTILDEPWPADHARFSDHKLYLGVPEQPFVHCYDLDGQRDPEFESPIFEAFPTPFFIPQVVDLEVDRAGGVWIAFIQLTPKDLGSPLRCASINSDGSINSVYSEEDLGLASVSSITFGPNGTAWVSDASPLGDAFRYLGIRDDGTIEPVVDMTGRFPSTGRPMSVHELTDGRRLLTGGFMEVDGVERRGLARLSDGDRFDPAFSDHLGYFSSNQSYLNALEFDSTGNMVVAGRFSIVNDSLRTGVVRFFPDGQVDPDFVYEISGEGRSIETVAIRGADIYLAGRGVSQDRERNEIVVRLDENGNRSNGFSVPEASWAGAVSSLEFDDLGRIYVGGRNLLDGDPNVALLRLLPDGSLDESFPTDPLIGRHLFQASIFSIDWLPDSREVLVGGMFYSSDHSVANLALMDEAGRFNTDSVHFYEVFFDQGPVFGPAPAQGVLRVGSDQLVILHDRRPESGQSSARMSLVSTYGLEGDPVDQATLPAQWRTKMNRSPALVGGWMLLAGVSIDQTIAARYKEHAILAGYDTASREGSLEMTNMLWAYPGYQDIRFTPSPDGTVYVMGGFSTLGEQPRYNIAALSLDTDSRSVPFANLSIRGSAEDGKRSLILGFIVEGDVAKQFVGRAVGPTLAEHEVESVATDPRLVLYKGPRHHAENDQWAAEPAFEELEARSELVGAFNLGRGSRDAALLIELEPGVYTGVVRNQGAEGGLSLVEIYDAAPSIQGSQLVNSSCRGMVRDGEETLIAGFVVDESVKGPVLVRAIGPGLAAFGVTDFLTDPVLIIYRDGEHVATNDDWEQFDQLDAMVEREAIVAKLRLENRALDASLLLDLDPGHYTAQVIAKEGASGVALVEIYL